MTSDTYVNPNSNTIDSSVCYTALSCFGNNCTVAAIIYDNEFKKRPRVTFFRSNDGGGTWTEQPHSFSDSYMLFNYGITKLQQIDSLYAIGIGDYGTVYRTSDAGATWHRRDVPTMRNLIDVHFSDSLNGILISSGTVSYDSTIFITTDGGIHWIDKSFLCGCNRVESINSSTFRLFGYGYGPILTTKDNFETIDTTKTIFNPTSDSFYSYLFTDIRFGKNNRVIAFGSYKWYDSTTNYINHGLIIRSTDGGVTWGKPYICSHKTLAQIFHVSSPDKDTIFATGGYYPFYLMSFDGGETWKIDSITIDTSYPIEHSFGIEVVNDGSPLAIFGPFEIASRHSIIAKGKYLQNNIQSGEVIKYYTRIFPNPVNKTVTIKTIPRMNDKVTIIDLNGKELMVDYLPDSGELTFDCSRLSSGLYSVIIEHNNRSTMIGKFSVVR
jgi:hypothetical protein